MAKRIDMEHKSELNMTPMIDVVFQLIIFFIITIKMEQDINMDIKLPEATSAAPVKSDPLRAMTVEVDERGWISMHGAQLTKGTFIKIMRKRYRRYGEFPVLIRGDHRTKHRDIKSIMDICSGIGIWRITFVAVQDPKTHE